MSIRKGRLTSQGVIAAPVNLNFPVGTILPFAGPSTQIPEGFLLCNGAEVNREDYADLFSIIDTKWGSGDGSTTFRIPTTQGLLLRGVAYGSGNDPDRDSRNAVQTGGQTGDEVGSFQNWRMQSHNHRMHIAGVRHAPITAADYNGDVSPAAGNGLFNINANRLVLLSDDANVSAPYAFNGNANNNAFVQGVSIFTTNNGGNQTVGQNVYVNYIIKY